MGRRAVDVLSRVPLFSGLSTRHLRRLSDLTEEARFMEGASIVKEGEEGDSFYVILAGQAKVVGRGGRVVAHLLPGDFFGEISLIDGGKRTASVVSETPLTTLILERKRFARMLEQEPGIAAKMLEELARRLRRLEHPISE